VVRGYDQCLTAQSRICTRQDSDHVPGRQRVSGFARHVEILKIAIVAACSRRQWRKTEALEALRNVSCCGIKAAAAGAPPFALGSGKPFDVGLHARTVERGLDLGKGFSWR